MHVEVVVGQAEVRAGGALHFSRTEVTPRVCWASGNSSSV